MFHKPRGMAMLTTTIRMNHLHLLINLFLSWSLKREAKLRASPLAKL
jgi:hypothetical protein